MSRIDQIEAVFHEALALAPGADMAAWLRGRCGEDAELSREVSSLLAARARIPSPKFRHRHREAIAWARIAWKR
jgi:hypothetical protein